ncbi:MAG: DNA mismatch repair endonuclease MutL [Thermacetogeniaceae bacterium]|nr:DNA mismatch repair endonuclease MutL [Syntrophomonadaceae bacterium]
MGKIVLLDQNVINQIAAGEVVERPASVVKELVENSIDAGASRITVEIKESGLKEIKVIDNGSGMTPDDAKMAVARHATSKIRIADDLNMVNTLGFRGEALAAISSVSRFTLLTRPPEAVAGTKVVVEGGKLKDISPVGCPYGTQIIVEDLFFNSQPRRKFLKSPRSEAAAVADVITRFALGYPDISFNYYSGKRLCLATYGQGDIMDVATIIYGKDSRARFLAVSYQEDGIKIEGIVSDPGYTRSSRFCQSFFVNKRLVRNFLLSHTLENAYQGMITSGRYPTAVIFIEIEPSMIDVNVHPTKSDIRFSDSQTVARVLYRGVNSALATFLQQQRGFQVKAGQSGPHQETAAQNSGEKVNYRTEPLPISMIPVFNRAFPEDLQVRDDIVKDRPLSKNSFFQEMQLIGQVLGTYIIAEREGNLFIIDQHAAHERVLYEKIKLKWQNKKMFSQKICPHRILLTPEEEQLYLENREFFQNVGYTLERETANRYFVITVPDEPHTNIDQFFREHLDLVRQAKEKGDTVFNIKEAAAKMYACKGAIKAGDRLTQAEMHQLLVQLDATDHPDHCPHGRPTYIKITDSDLSRWFHR